MAATPSPASAADVTARAPTSEASPPTASTPPEIGRPRGVLLGATGWQMDVLTALVALDAPGTARQVARRMRAEAEHVDSALFSLWILGLTWRLSDDRYRPTTAAIITVG